MVLLHYVSTADIEEKHVDYSTTSPKIRKLRKGEYRDIIDKSGRYPPYRLHWNNFITCLLCNEDTYVCPKSFKHHFTKRHGKTWINPSVKKMDEYVSLKGNVAK